jgi:hypothetical protein
MAASAFSIMFLIAMASLILVLLAIERNTRSHAITYMAEGAGPTIPK